MPTRSLLRVARRVGSSQQIDFLLQAQLGEDSINAFFHGFIRCHEILILAEHCARPFLFHFGSRGSLAGQSRPDIFYFTF